MRIRFFILLFLLILLVLPNAIAFACGCTVVLLPIESRIDPVSVGGGGGVGVGAAVVGAGAVVGRTLDHLLAIRIQVGRVFMRSTVILFALEFAGAEVIAAEELRPFSFYLCDNVIVTSASVSCDHSTTFTLNAVASWPAIPVDVRPYPATLNRWPTVLRVDSLPTSTGSAFRAYVSAVGGSSANPAIGDWRNITLTNTIYPDPGVLPQVYLQNIGWIIPPIGQLYTFQWPLPSHPAAGGGPTAGAVGQLQELPQDMPLYTNQARAAYLVECDIGLSTIYESLCERPWSRRKYRLR